MKSEISGHVQNTEAVVRRCSVKKTFLEISQNSHESTCAIASFSIKLQASTPLKHQKTLQGLEACMQLFKKRLWHRSFPVNFAKFLRTPFLRNIYGRLSHILSLYQIYLSSW